jgi:hypothetical protein
MKGPSERLKYELRRLWECPTCKKRERTPGSVTFRHCMCLMSHADGKPVVMKLLEDGVLRVAPPIVPRCAASEEAPAATEIPAISEPPPTA